MNDLYYTVVVVTVAFLIVMALYVCSSFSYVISNNTLKMDWRILKYVRFASREINIDNIQEVRRFRLKQDLFGGGYVFGNLFIKAGVIIILKRRLLFCSKVYITPKEPDIFIEQIINKL